MGVTADYAALIPSTGGGRENPETSYSTQKFPGATEKMRQFILTNLKLNFIFVQP